MAPLTQHLRGIALTAPWVAYLLAVDVALSGLVPLRALFPDLSYNTSSALAGTVWAWIQRIFTQSNGARIEITGDELPKGESAVVVCNHLAWSDFYMIQALAMRAGMLGRCRYFAKIQLRWVPFLGWGMWVMGFPMVSRRWDRDSAEMDRVFSGIVKRQWPTWLISFSEATRFTPKKYAESKAFCNGSGRTQPRHLLYPRTKGFVATVRHLRQAPHVKAVYDLAIAYQRRGSGVKAVQGEGWMVTPSFWDTLSKKGFGDEKGGYRLRVHARRFEIKELPESEEELAEWLVQRWVEKGEWLEKLRLEWATEEEGGKKQM